MFNVNRGRAFDFRSKGGTGGRILVFGKGARPFTTNATGVATGLNADRVDGLHASQLIAKARQRRVVTRRSSTSSVSPKTAAVSCPTGTVVFGGGASVSGAGNVAIGRSYPSGNGWTARAFESSATDAAWSLTVFAICA